MVGVQTQQQSISTVESCPLCTIPSREPILYDDGVVYLVRTQNMKGHHVRVMACTHRHTDNPTLDELVRMFILIYNYMTVNCSGEWCIVDNTYGSIPDHAHYTACDTLGTPEELEQLAKTPKTHFPLNSIMIGIPAHNEEANIGKVIETARRFGDVVVYNDGSTDETAKVSILHKAHVLNPHRETENQGYGYGLKQLFNYAEKHGYQTLVTIDGDGQHDPREIMNLLVALNNADVVIGNRFIAGSKTPLHRELFIHGLSFVTGIGDSQSGFRAYNRRAIETIVIEKDDMSASLDSLTQIIYNGLKVTEVPITITYEDTQHSESPITQGWTLAETLFWTQIWGKPITTLGTMGTLTGLAGLYFILRVMKFWYVNHTFVFNLAIVGTGFLMTSMMLFLGLMFVLVNRKLYRELKK